MIGQRIGAYRVTRLFREGRIAISYEAEDDSGGRALIKVLTARAAEDDELRRRFVNEARAVSAIDHPSMLRIYGSGELPGGLPYFIGEHPGGESLMDRQQRLGAPLGTAALPLFHQIAAALAVAHERGIIHRNLKSDTIFVVPRREGGEEAVKIADFGLAKLPRELQAPGAELETTNGRKMGTPVYMAPELFGSAAKADGRADVYSLGILLYEALSGQPPFDSPSPAQIMGMHLFQEPPPLAQRAPSAPKELVTLVHAMLVKEPRERMTMAQVERRLARLCGLAPAGPEEADEAAKAAAARRPRPAVTAAIALGVLGLAGLGVYLSGALAR